jgi:DNA-binding winged helix-turn-helix (wHTH) protein
VEVRFGPFRLHPIEGLSRGARELHVTPKSLSVLYVLASRPGRVVAKDDLVRAVWHDVAVSDSALTSCIKELRRALKDDAKHPRFIETLNRRGYRFIAEIAAPVASTPERASRTDRTSTGSLIGRENVLAAMSAALDRASNGERQIVFVAGEPGIGKTAVVDAFMREVERVGRWRLTHGQCVEHYGASEPYQPLLDALARLCRPTADSFVAILRQYAPSWLAQLPALQTPSEVRLLTRRTSGVTSERMQRELMDALERMAADTPIVLWLEDVHWSDLATLDWLAAFAARTDGARLLLIATYRTADVRAGRHPLPAIVDDLRIKARCEAIALPGLTQADVCAYLTARFPANAGALEDLGVLVHHHTEGNPLFVVNVLRDLLVRGVLREVDGRWTADSGMDAASFGIPEDVRRQSGPTAPSRPRSNSCTRCTAKSSNHAFTPHAASSCIVESANVWRAATAAGPRRSPQSSPFTSSWRATLPAP